MKSKEDICVEKSSGDPLTMPFHSGFLIKIFSNSANKTGGAKIFSGHEADEKYLSIVGSDKCGDVGGKFDGEELVIVGCQASETRR